MMRADFLQRQRDALSRRVQPAGPLTFKQIGHAIGMSADTVGRWSRGEVVMDAATVDALDQFFIGCGDVTFLVELYGEQRAIAMQRRADRMRKEAEAIERASFTYVGAVA